jgi:AsmA-like C-terminal region
LRADQLATDELNQILNPAAAKRPWYKFLSPNPSNAVKPYLAAVEASGKLAANRVDVHGLTALRVSGSVELKRGKLRISDLHGDMLGGKHSGELRVDFTGKVPEYSGTGTLDQFALGQLADVMHDPWVTGTASVEYKASASGVSAAELFSSASATILVDAHDGTLAHLALPNSVPPLRMHSFSDRMVLRHSLFEIQEGKLETPSGIYQVSGTASLGRVLDVKLARDGAHGFNISGTLNAPKVSPATNAETQAALKP